MRQCGSEEMSAENQFLFTGKDEREAERSCGEALAVWHEAHFL